MILLQNPNMPVPTNAVEIDAAILDIKGHLETGLSWLTNGYGRTYKNLDARNGVTVFYPEAYLGEQNNSHRYINLSPDNDKQGQCFFYVVKETISQFQPGMYSFLSYDTAIIFSVNMELINDALLQTEVFQQVLVAQVRDVLTRQLMGAAYQLTISSVDFLFENVYSEFDLADAQQLEKAPLSHFRFNCTIKLPETCPVPTIVPPITTCYSLDFDGVNEYIDCTNNVAFNQDFNTQFSVSAWVKFDTIATINLLMSKYNLSPKGWQFRIEYNRISLFLKESTGPNQIQAYGNTIITTTGQWYHLTATYDGSNTLAGVKLYVNGAPDLVTGGGGSVVGTFQNTEPLLIGQTTNGNIANARMWNTELTSIQIAAEYNSGTILSPAVQVANLIVDTDINNATFGTEWEIPDTSGITAGYTSANMEVEDRVEECPIPVVRCYSLLFDGVMEYIQAPLTVGIYDIGDSFSFSGWIKRTGGTFSSLFSKLLYTNSVTQDGYRCYITSSNIVVNLYGGGGSGITVASIGSVTLNQWSNVTVTYDGSGVAAGVNIYLDGVLMAKSVGSDNFTGTMLNVRPLTIGGQPTAFNPLYWLGNIAKARMWDTELTSIQAAAEYNGGQILSTAVQGVNLVLDTDINNATFGTEWEIPDLTGITAGYESANMEIGDRVEDCPS